jgi:hypothetical protein
MGTLFTSKTGGARRDRTADLNTASVALSQLSYGPRESAYFNQALYYCQGINRKILGLDLGYQKLLLTWLNRRRK